MYNETITVYVEKQELAAVISGGNRYHGADLDLVLSALNSNDPDELNSTWAYSWSCMNATALEKGCNCSADATGDLANFPYCAHGYLQLPETGNLTIPANSLSAGNQYRFIAFVTKDDRNATATVVITVTAGAPPSVLVENLSASKYNSNAGSYLDLDGAVTTTSLGIQSLDWTMTVGDSATNYFASSATGSETVTLDLSQLTAGYTYSFRLTAVDVDGLEGRSEVSVPMNTAPTSGSADITPGSGFALTTSFEIRASDWTDDADDLPLLYNFNSMVGYDTGNMADELESVLLAFDLNP